MDDATKLAAVRLIRFLAKPQDATAVHDQYQAVTPPGPAAPNRQAPPHGGREMPHGFRRLSGKGSTWLGLFPGSPHIDRAPRSGAIFRASSGRRSPRVGDKIIPLIQNIRI
jgi:hypothetical protein